MGVIFGQKNRVNFSPLFRVLWNGLLFFLFFFFSLFKVYVKELGTLSEQSFSSSRSYCFGVEEVEGLKSLNRNEMCVDKSPSLGNVKLQLSALKRGASPTVPNSGVGFKARVDLLKPSVEALRSSWTTILWLLWKCLALSWRNSVQPAAE